MQENVKILNELKELDAADLINAAKTNIYSIPQGYFNGFADGILVNIFIQSLPPANPYTVPAAYFKNLPDIVLEKVIFNSIEHTTAEKNVYTIPEGYFSGLADNVLKKIKEQNNDVQREVEEISPLVASISRKNVYALPDNYFGSINPLPGIDSKVETRGKVVFFGNRSRKWINYAAAACIAVVLFSGAYFLISTDKSKGVNKPVASVGKHEDVQKEMAALSDSEIENYLEHNNNMEVFPNVGLGDDQHQGMDIHNLIRNIPDEEIQEYLKEDEPATKGEGI